MDTSVTSGHEKVMNPSAKRYKLLDYRGVSRLAEVMEATVPIHGVGNFPTLQISPSELVKMVCERLESYGVKVQNVRLNGSAATHVLSQQTSPTYKDLDLIFTVETPPSELQNNSNSNNSTVTEKRKADEHQRRRKRQSPEGTKTRPSSLPSTVRQRHLKPDDKYSEDLSLLEDSGYTSSGSSVSSAPVSPSASASFIQDSLESRTNFRSRTRSLESTSSSTSSLISSQHPKREEEQKSSFSSYHPLQHQNQSSWQKIKDSVLEILLELLPEGVVRSNMTSVVLGTAYVQKMVKVANDSDKWSLISLNNNSGRNLELKFVQSMRRQFEFSVDSFQIILDTYLGFTQAARHQNLEMNADFHPTIVAESVYGDINAALRHLKHRRICTHRPEEIRGGGLLRYCNLLVRDFVPGDCDDSGKATGSFAAGPDMAARLEQHMCSRFFIDFSDIDRQRKKLISYLDNHFGGEDDLKFQYLLVLRRVVDYSTICLMQHERAMILNLITMLVRQTLANNVAQSKHEAAVMQQRIQQDYHIAQYYGECTPQPTRNYLPAPVSVSDRSSPMSAYSSSFTPSTAGDVCSAPISPAPQSRPITPNDAGPACEYTPKEPQNYPVPPQCCCCCCHCSGCCYSNQAQENYPQPPYYPPSSDVYQAPVPYQPIEPVFFRPDSMVCYYHPASYSNPT
ncbi:uncharacterized protein LOC100185204 [Ciona intestinalis]